ncbi:MAG TPA: hypothetical protein VNW06_00510 [Cytophagaceae bacterium]|jgi:hypothetical protein|nr:hypothetical protein [Cytophagaceae bacterium]
MKNKIIILGLAIVATTMFSCKKDYTCQCSKVRVTSTGSTSTDDGSYIFNDNKASAVSKCNAQESTGSDINGDYSRQCEIK